MKIKNGRTVAAKFDDLSRGAPHTPQCTSIAIPHKPQSSILNPHCTTKCGTFMFVPHVPQMWYKFGTQKGPHTASSDLK